jgi:hypothetical protein
VLAPASRLELSGLTAPAATAAARTSSAVARQIHPALLFTSVLFDGAQDSYGGGGEAALEMPMRV